MAELPVAKGNFQYLSSIALTASLVTQTAMDDRNALSQSLTKFF
jgi:hypothetical protein